MKSLLVCMLLIIFVILSLNECESPTGNNTIVTQDSTYVPSEPENEPDKESEEVVSWIIFKDDFEEVGNWILEADSGNYDWDTGNVAIAVISNGTLTLWAMQNCGEPLARATYVISKNRKYKKLRWKIRINSAGAGALGEITFKFYVNKSIYYIHFSSEITKPVTLFVNYSGGWNSGNAGSLFYSPRYYTEQWDSLDCKICIEANGTSADCYGAAKIIIDEISVIAYQ